MQTVIIACQTISAEVELAMEHTGCAHDVIWIESGLHNNPDMLRARLQEQLDELKGYDRVLMAFGTCGNSVVDLHTGDFELILPRVDDCITLMLGSQQERNRISQGAGTYFLTKGWMKHESNIYSEYQYTLKKYGARRTKSLYKTILAHYDKLAIVDTGTYAFDEFIEFTKPVAEALGLRQYPVKGTISYIEELFTDPYDPKRFTIVPPNTVITMKLLNPEVFA